MIRLDKSEALDQLTREPQATAGACPMCSLSSPDARLRHVAESDHGVVVLDGYAATVGHLLVVSREHIERPVDVGWAVYADLQRLVWESFTAIERVLAPTRVYVAALGSSSPLPMSFPHLHWHVIPVYSSDETARPAHVFSWSTGVVRYEAGEDTAMVERLSAAWPMVPGNASLA